MKLLLLSFCLCCSLYGRGQVGMYHGEKLIKYEVEQIDGSWHMKPLSDTVIDDTILIKFTEHKIIITGKDGGTYKLTERYGFTDSLSVFDGSDLYGLHYLIYWKRPEEYVFGVYYQLDIMHGKITKEFYCKELLYLNK